MSMHVVQNCNADVSMVKKTDCSSVTESGQCAISQNSGLGKTKCACSVAPFVMDVMLP